MAFVLFACGAAADTTPPQLINFGISPLTADASAGPANFTVSIAAQESNGAGTASITLSLQPSGATVIGHQAVAMTGGTSANPLFQFNVNVPQFTVAGVYLISLTLVDAASNTATFNPSTLQAMGFPSTVTIADSAFGSVTLSASTANIAASGGAGSLQVIASNSGFAWSASSNAPWLTITSDASGTGTGTLEYFVAANTTSAQRSGIITVSGQTFTVIQAAALASLSTLQGSLVFNYQIGGATPPAQTLTAYSSGAPLNFTATASSAGNWLFVSPSSGVTSAVLNIFVNPTGLAAGAYAGSVTVSAPASANGSQAVGVTLTVSAGPGLTVTPGSLSFSYQQGGATPAAQNLSAGAGSATAVTASASSTGGWLAVSPASATTPATLAVSVAAAGLAAGTYSGSVEITAPAGSQIVPVTLVVTAAPAIAVNPSALAFTYILGASIPAAQTLSLSGPSSGLSYTASASSAGNWLSLGATSGAIPGTLSVSVSPAGLAAGQYNGSITLTPSSGAPQSVTVTLFVTSGSAFTVSPSALSFGVAPGAISAAAQTLTIAPNGPGLTYTASASTQDGAGWLLVSPSGPSASGVFSVSLMPSQLAAGAHTGTITITGQSASQNVPVTVFVTPPITATPSSLTFNFAQGGALPAAQTVALSAGGSSQSFSASAVSNANWLSVSPLAGVTPATISISADPAGLTAGTYAGTVMVQENQLDGNSLPISVTLTVGSALTISPSSAQVNYQAGDANPNALSFSITGAPASFTATASSTGNWLTVSPARGTIPGSLTAHMAPSGLSAGQYAGTIQLLSGGSSQTITISLNVVSPQSLTLNPGSLTFSYQTGASTPPSQNITVGCPNSALAFRPVASSAGNWLSVSVPGVEGNNQIIVSVNPAGLSPNTYAGTVTVFGVGACNTSQTVAVTLVISSAAALTSPGPTSPGPTLPVTGPPSTSAGTLAFSAPALAFSAASGGSAPAPQSVSVTCGAAAAAFTAEATSDAGWLSATPLSGTTPAAFTLAANPNGLAVGTYSGSVGVSSSACGSATLTVTLTESAGAGTLTALSIAPASLTFNVQAGGASPASQTLSITGPADVSFTAAASSGWLSVSPASGAAPAALTVTVNAAGLLAGTYMASIMLATGTGSSGASQNVSVTLAVSGGGPPTAAALSFTYQLGGALPAAQTLPAPGTAGIGYTAIASSPSNWLNVAPGSGTLPANLSVTVNPAGLAAGSYAGVITITPSGGAAESVPVTLAVTDGAVPFLTSLVNAASMLIGPIAGGEIISVFGQGLGPSAGADLSLTPAGVVSGSVAGTRLLIDGVPAPLIYTQDGQVNAVVPYSVAGKPAVSVELEYQGTQSAPSKILVADAAPAIFTLDQSGQGQGAILDEDASVNSGLNPAAPGSIAVLFGTGAGSLDPAGEDGAITDQPAQTVLPVSVLVDGEETEILYAGPAPGLISGALQVNFRLPLDVTTGKGVGILLKVGRFTSQPGVTLAIR